MFEWASTIALPRAYTIRSRQTISSNPLESRKHFAILSFAKITGILASTFCVAKQPLSLHPFNSRHSISSEGERFFESLSSGWFHKDRGRRDKSI